MLARVKNRDLQVCLEVVEAGRGGGGVLARVKSGIEIC